MTQAAFITQIFIISVFYGIVSFEIFKAFKKSSFYNRYLLCHTAKSTLSQPNYVNFSQNLDDKRVLKLA